MQPPMEAPIVRQPGLRHRARWYGAAVIMGLVALTPARATAQASADSVSSWTRTMQVGTLAARDTALAKLAEIPVTALPAATQRVLVAELNRVHQAMQAGTAIGFAGKSENLVRDYYTTLVLVVTAFDTRESALALVPAVAVSGGVSRQVAQLGDTGVTLLIQQLRGATQSDEHVGLLQSLGLAWFWADSTGSPLSDRSRAQIVSALTTAGLSPLLADMGGVELALEVIHDPGFLPLAQRVHDFAATQGVLGRSTVVTMAKDVIPSLTALAASRPPIALATGLARLVTAVCGTDAAGRRQGACQSLANDIAAASKHLADGQTTPARNGFDSVGTKIDKAYADGAFTDAEHALLAGNVAMLLQRLTP